MINGATEAHLRQHANSTGPGLRFTGPVDHRTSMRGHPCVGKFQGCGETGMV
jgi:hypothetical protein